MKVSQYFEFERVSVNRILRNFLINFLPDLFIINHIVRPALARLCGMNCAPGVKLEKGIFYGNPKNVSIGRKCGISRGAFLDGYEKIIIGNNVGVAFQVTFITSTHELGSEEQRLGKGRGKPIVIGDGVWIGARAIIGPGVEIGAGSMIAAGAAVMSSVPPNSLVAGVPGRVITRLPGVISSQRSPEPEAPRRDPKLTDAK
jgi:acetyltransferase-like isoleucine patch superfamily enzyme